MTSLFAPSSGILSLPYEVRRIIYHNLAECEDVTPLMQTCRLLHAEVWSCMPGDRYINYAQHRDPLELLRRIHKLIEVSAIEIIAEPWYSSGSALKIRLTWRYRDSGDARYTNSTWTIRDLASPMARIACLYSTKRVGVVFEPAIRGNLQAALLILRAKVFDICRLMLYMRSAPGREPFEVAILFRGGKDESRPNSTRKSFWEMRPIRVAQSVWRRLPAASTALVRHFITRFRKGREQYPFFYESLMLPFFSCHSWTPVDVWFDLEPAKKHSSFFYANANQQINYLGCRSLVQTQQLLREIGWGRLSWPYFGRYTTSMALDELHRRMVQFSRDSALFLTEKAGPEADQLRLYLRRMRESHPANPFAGDPYYNPAWSMGVNYGRSPLQFYKGCYGGEDDNMRMQLIQWALIDVDK